MVARVAYVTAAVLALASADALAQPEVRDHRTGPAVEPAPQASVRYRRRPGPRFMMPLKVDIGAASSHTDRGIVHGLWAAIGIHWASLSPQPTQTDVGLGVFGAIASTPEDTSVMNDKPTVAQGGAYLEIGHTLSRGNFWRTWGTGRAEYLGSSAFGEDHVGIGATGRLSAELFVSGVGIEPRGLFLGTYAIGRDVGAGYRHRVAGRRKLPRRAGLTFRTPLVFAP